LRLFCIQINISFYRWGKICWEMLLNKRKVCFSKFKILVLLLKCYWTLFNQYTIIVPHLFKVIHPQNY